MNSVTIIGSGLAGYNLAKEIRKLDKTISLTIVTADGGESYSKPMLSNALNKGKTAKQLVISDADKMATQLNATVLSNTRVESIDRQRRLLKTSKGELNYETLVLAVGASQLKLPMTGDAVEAILSVNNLEEYEAYQEALERSQSVAIIGSGLIGCEFANDLLSVNRQVTVIGLSEIPLDRLLLPEIGVQLKNAFSEKGIHWCLGVSAESVTLNSDSDQYRISLSDGSHVDADLVVSAIGLKPDIELAQQAGLQVNRGIVVDRYLQTSDQDIFALGDCIEIEGLVMAYVLPIMNAARTLAKTLTGTKTKVNYPAMPVVIKTPDYPMVVSPPAMGIAGDWQLEIDADGARALFIGEDGQLKGFALTNKKISEKQALTKQLPAVLD